MASERKTARVGWGDEGRGASSSEGTVLGLGLRGVGVMRGNQTAAMTVKVSQVGGKRVGGTMPGSYTCATPNAGVVSVPINAYGRKLVRRHGRLAVKLTFRLINGSGVTHTRVWSGVIRPEL